LLAHARRLKREEARIAAEMEEREQEEARKLLEAAQKRMGAKRLVIAEGAHLDKQQLMTQARAPDQAPCMHTHCDWRAPGQAAAHDAGARLPSSCACSVVGARSLALHVRGAPTRLCGMELSRLCRTQYSAPPPSK
jgi:hypothetical protein